MLEHARNLEFEQAAQPATSCAAEGAAVRRRAGELPARRRRSTACDPVQASAERAMPSRKVLFVCTGNICRSPTAEGVFRHQVQAAGLARSDRMLTRPARTTITSAKPPDPRTQAAARSARLRSCRAARAPGHGRTISSEFDYVLAMDRRPSAQLQRSSPAEHCAKLRLFLDFGAARWPSRGARSVLRRRSEASSSCSTWSRRQPAACSSICAGELRKRAQVLRGRPSGRARAAVVASIAGPTTRFAPQTSGRDVDRSRFDLHQRLA